MDSGTLRKVIAILSVIVLVSVAVVVAFSFEKNDGTEKGTIDTYVIGKDAYGHMKLGASSSDFKKAGFVIGDMLKVEFEDGKNISMLYWCDYNMLPMMSFLVSNDVMSVIGVYNINIYMIMDYEPDTLVHISYNKEHINPAEDFPHLMHERTRDECGSDIAYCNFREVNVGNLVDGRIFRSGGYCDAKYNDRADIFENLFRERGITDELCMVEKPEVIDKYFETPKGHEYLENMYSDGRIHSMYMGVDMYIQYDQYHDALIQIADVLNQEDAKIDIHCIMGKDRTGFIFMLLEGMAGASNEEIEDDFMMSYVNTYGFEKGTKEYDMVKHAFVDISFVIFDDVDIIKFYNYIKWEEIDCSDLNYSKIACKYLKEHVLSEEEYQYVYDAITRSN